MTGPEPVLEIRGLSFRYPETVSGRIAHALSHVSLAVRQGECVLVSGPSGSGKSTLARCTNGLIPHATPGAFEGTVLVRGMDTRDHDVTEFAPHVGMVFQDPGHQLVTGDVESEIAFGLETRNVPEREIRERLSGVADLVGIRHLMGRRTESLSWGERQRVAIASVLVLQPSILVMDEPLSGIDASAARNLSSLLSDLKSRSRTTIMVFEHRITPLLPVADRLVAMRDGAIVSDERVVSPGLLSWTTPKSLSRLPCPPDCSAGTPPLSPRGEAAAPSLSFRDVFFRYPGTNAAALDGITLDFFPGELAVLTGPNGSGKTTLLKHCNGLLVPDRGSVFIGTDPLAGRTVASAARSVGLLNQHADYQLFESTIADEMAFGPRNLGRTENEIGLAVREAIRKCSLDHLGSATPPLGLSGGEKQRVAIAGILAMDTPILILDEPTFGLDPGLKDAFCRLLRDLRRAGRTVIVATHDAEFAGCCGDRFIGISTGRIESDTRISRQHDGCSLHDATTSEPGGCR